MSAFLATTLLGEVGERRDEPKAEQKLSLGAGFYVTIGWKGSFTQSQVLLSSIVVSKWVFLGVRKTNKIIEFMFAGIHILPETG